MNIHEIENLSAAELKAKRAELIEAAKAVPIGELAERYVKARTDATIRDEKLAEQGGTIDALRAGAAALTEKNSDLANVVEQNYADFDILRESARKTAQADKLALDEALASLERETARAERLRTVATRHHAAVSGAAKLLNDALAAQAVDQADADE
jgi:hypothetical protein